MRIVKLEGGRYLARLGTACVNFDYGSEMLRFLGILSKVTREGFEGEKGMGTRKGYFKATKDIHGKGYWVSVSRGGEYILSVRCNLSVKSVNGLIGQFIEVTNKEKYKRRAKKLLGQP